MRFKQLLNMRNNSNSSFGKGDQNETFINSHISLIRLT